MIFYVSNMHNKRNILTQADNILFSVMLSITELTNEVIKYYI